MQWTSGIRRNNNLSNQIRQNESFWLENGQMSTTWPKRREFPPFRETSPLHTGHCDLEPDSRCLVTRGECMLHTRSYVNGCSTRVLTPGITKSPASFRQTKSSLGPLWQLKFTVKGQDELTMKDQKFTCCRFPNRSERFDQEEPFPTLPEKSFPNLLPLIGLARVFTRPILAVQ